MTDDRTPWLRVFLLYACGVGAGMQFAKASVAFDALMAHYAVGPTFAGWFVSAVGLIGIVFGATAGLIVARLGARAALIGALAASVVISLAEAALPPAPLFLALRGIEGAAHLTIVVAGPTSMTGIVAPRHRPLAMGLWGTFMSVAILVCGAAAPGLIARFGLGSLFLAHAGLMAALTLGALLAAPASRSARGGGGSLAGLARQHVEIYANIRTATPALCFLCYTGMYLALQTLTPELAPAASRHTLIVGMAGVSILASLLAGFLAQRGLSPFRLTLFGFAATLIASGFVALASGATLAPAALARMAFVSLLPGAIWPLVPKLNADAPAQARAFGAAAQTGNVGSTLGPPLFAASATALGPIGLLIPTAALCLVGAALTIRAERRLAR